MELAVVVGADSLIFWPEQSGREFLGARSAAQAHGRSSSMLAAGHRLTSLVRTSAR